MLSIVAMWPRKRSTGELGVVILLQEPIMDLIEMTPLKPLKEVGKIRWIRNRQSSQQKHELCMMEKLVYLCIPIP